MIADAATAAGVVRRYLLAKARTGIKERESDAALRGLEYDIERGMTLLPGGILIDLNVRRIIVADDADPAFFEAIVEGKDSAIDIDARELEQWRRFIFADGPPPRYREPC